MTNEEFSLIAKTAYGRGWQSAVARALNVNVRTVQRIASGDTGVSPTLADALRKAVGMPESHGDSNTWPRDRWLTAYSGNRQYIIHTHHPKFICRAVMLDENGRADTSEQPADTTSGLTYDLPDNCLLCEFVWIDAPPPGADLKNLLDVASDFFSTIDLK